MEEKQHITCDQKLIKEDLICHYCKKQCGPLVKWHEVVCKKNYVPTDKMFFGEDSTSYKYVKKAVKSKGRKCLICGKDPKPNYFYCIGCHNMRQDDQFAAG
jgi:hypothetical protein